MNQNKPSTLTNQVKSVLNKTKNMSNKVMNTTSKLKNSISSGITNKVNKISNTSTKPQWFQNASSYLNTFVETNTAFSKFVFIILVLVLFVFLFQLGMIIITKMINGFSGEVYVLKGLMPSNMEKIISNNPNNQDSVAIIKSVNQDDGIEFTWNVWFYVNSLNNTSGNYDYRKIFSKGISTDTSVYNTSNIMKTNAPYSKIINNSPGMYLTKYIPDSTGSTAPDITFGNPANKNDIALVVVINTFNVNTNSKDFAEFITVDKIPISKWVICSLNIKNRTVNVYINGKLNKSVTLQNVPTQNNYDTYIGENGGFSGYISNLRYFNRSITYDEILSINSYGPNLTSVDTIDTAKQDYLSMNWYYNVV
jgi:hypothetical protein